MYQKFPPFCAPHSTNGHRLKRLKGGVYAHPVLDVNHSAADLAVVLEIMGNTLDRHVHGTFTKVGDDYIPEEHVKLYPSGARVHPEDRHLTYDHNRDKAIEALQSGNTHVILCWVDPVSTKATLGILQAFRSCL